MRKKQTVSRDLNAQPTAYHYTTDPAYVWNILKKKKTISHDDTCKQLKLETIKVQFSKKVKKLA